MSDPRIGAIGQLRNMAELASGRETVSNAIQTEELSFKDLMNKYKDDANDLQIKADNDIKKIISGDDIDPHSVMIASEKASLTLDLVLEIRNKVLEAYREVMKTQV